MANTEKTPEQKAEEKRIAITIFKQMGGGQMKAMVGAHTFLSMGRDTEKGIRGGIGFKFKGCKKANYVRVTYLTNDLYKVELIKVHRIDSKVPFTVVSEDTGYYDDMLRPWFERETGLDTSLEAVYG